ncbi:hypothetical protein DV704_11425 [Meiothermus sp. QL-1]|uniref:hypothetical protein n=1 Tax=Meiothermus sp. QL-1 TaxID=2058095 RepID=UPI000E0A4C5A|nr:hypothetical protein [Meiothermus sp. QL-1]RDI94595.1 hypothetical protein DV704_11425 [Meiothermus sp. QL-1]
MPDDPTRFQKGLLRYVAGLLNRCPHWVAALVPDQACVRARSPSGLLYRIQLEAQAPAHPQALQERLEAHPYPAHRFILLVLEGKSPFSLPKGVHLWTLAELDYLVMAADLESNAPLAYLGLEVELPQATPPSSSATRPGLWYKL